MKAYIDICSSEIKIYMNKYKLNLNKCCRLFNKFVASVRYHIFFVGVGNTNQNSYS